MILAAVHGSIAAPLPGQVGNFLVPEHPHGADAQRKYQEERDDADDGELDCRGGAARGVFSIENHGTSRYSSLRHPPPQLGIRGPTLNCNVRLNVRLLVTPGKFVMVLKG